jgi:hypothetical protein
MRLRMMAEGSPPSTSDPTSLDNSTSTSFNLDFCHIQELSLIYDLRSECFWVLRLAFACYPCCHSIDISQLNCRSDGLDGFGSYIWVGTVGSNGTHPFTLGSLCAFGPGGLFLLLSHCLWTLLSLSCIGHSNTHTRYRARWDAQPYWLG